MALSPENKQTLIIMWVFTWVSMIIMASRLVMRKARGQYFDISDKLTMLCMFFLVGRCGMIHVVLIWGSNNVTQAFRKHHVFGPREIYEREVGSKLTLAIRTFYNSFIWLQKCVVMVFYKRILFGLSWSDFVMKIYWAILAATYVVIQVVTFTDCRPLHLYWQVVPDPGTCSEALGQLIILAALNIFTDILLIILPMPALVRVKRSLGAKIRLISLFSLGFFLVVVTIIRLPINFSHGFEQVSRTTWASVESLTATIVANVPTLYSLRKRMPKETASMPTTLGSESRRRRTGSQTSINCEGTKVEDEEGITVTQSVELFETDRSTPSANGVNDTWDEAARKMRSRDMSTGGQSIRKEEGWRRLGTSEEELVGV